MANNESRRPHNWFYNHVSAQWELRGGKQGNPLMAISDKGFNVFGLAGTLGNLGIGTLLTAQAISAAGVGSIAQIRAENFRIGAGGTLTLIKKHTGTISLAAIGTSAIAVATISGMGSAGIAVGDMIFYTLKGAATADSVFTGKAYIPTTNVVCIDIGNTLDTGGGSLPAVGVDVLQIKTS